MQPTAALSELAKGFRFDELAETGPSTVCWRATREDDGRAVIIKAVKAGIRGRNAALDALGREIECLQKLPASGFPQLLQVIRRDEEIALVFIDRGGARVDEVMRKAGRLELVEALAVCVKVAGALRALHGEGLVHGAVRPEMVELTELGEVQLHGMGAWSAEVPPDELVLVAHMAPEQVLGERSTPATDVFLLGALLYRLLSGASPFGREGGVGSSIRHATPTPLTQHEVAVPRALRAVVMRCLERRPPARYPDMASLEAELVRVLREHTALASEQLVTRARARGGWGSELPGPLEPGVDRGVGHRMRFLRRGLGIAIIASLIVGLIAIALRIVRTAPVSRMSGPRGIVRQPALLRVLARPWAQVYIDGQLAETTPVGHAIELPAGSHQIVFKHPTAPDELRDVEIVAGQTIVLDVEMQVVRPSKQESEESSP